ncbi:hypothetical protein MMC06_002434 [Schaereria dolodes]|nr:hypothetical protein [Schaereria dolodes]
MAPPSQLSIATSSLLRLVKEEASYHKELVQQQSRIQKLQKGGGEEDENAHFRLKQEQRAVEETKAVFPQMRDRIRAALEKLEEQLEAEKEAEIKSNVDEITKAKELVAKAKTSYREIA